MENAEDFADFGSHFLDSMLEVEMTEEDGEVNVSQTEARVRDLPPIPRFDLQSETLSYKDVYTNSVMPAKQQTGVLGAVTTTQLPGTATAISVPVIQSAPMLVIPSNLLKTNNAPLKTNAIVAAPSQPVITKSGSVLKTLLTKSENVMEMANDFMRQVFRPDFAKKVFTKQEPARDVSTVGAEEERYYKSIFKDVSKIQLCKLHCTICDKHLGCGKDVEKKLNVHNMLKVLTCKVCREFYGDGNFPCDDGDHCEIYCRWCGQGGALICCSFCPKVFCKKCVRRNYGRSFLRSIEKASDWACFICAQKPLWPHRAVCRALLQYIDQKKMDPKFTKDTSVCCKPPPVTVTKKTAPDTGEKNKVFLSGGQTIQLNANGKDQPIILAGADMKGGKLIPPITAKTIGGNGSLVVKNLKLNDSMKGPPGLTLLNKAPGITITPKRDASVISAPARNILLNNKTISSVPPLATVPGLTIPRSISTPIYHGQTLITPPGVRPNSVQKRPVPLAPAKDTVSGLDVKVSVTDTVNVDISKIPVAKIPHNVQGGILRLNFPDNKVQLVRLLMEGGKTSGASAATTFPMPKFENSDNLDFLEGNLEDSFKLTKMLYERLMKIKETLNTKTRHTKEIVYKSSVKKLSFIYEKARELMKELDDNLIMNYEVWKNDCELEKSAHVARAPEEKKVTPLQKTVTATITFGAKGRPSAALAHPAAPKAERQTTSIFNKNSKVFAQDDDSDVEVIASSSGNSLTSQRTLGTGGKRSGGTAPVTSLRPTRSRRPTGPAMIDLSKLSNRRGTKRRRGSRRGRKRLRTMDRGTRGEELQKDPLAVDGEEVAVAVEEDKKASPKDYTPVAECLTNIVEIKQETPDDV